MQRILTVAAVVGAAVAIVAILAILVQRIRRLLASAREPRPLARGPVQPESAGRPESGPPETDRPATDSTRARSPLIASPRLAGVTLLAVAGLTLIGGLVYVTVGAPWLLARQHFPSPPEQPIYFSHEVHVQQAGLDCAFCHRTADRATTAGLPDVQQCMFCHGIVEDLHQTTQRAAYEGQIARVQTAWREQAPIEWARVHRLPDHTRFPHDAHIQAGVACATCHGDVERMDLARQVRSLKMGDCVACHQETGAPNECVDCHH